MNEKENLVKRVDELIDILNIIAKDLGEISKTLKAFNLPSVPTRNSGVIKDVQTLFPRELVEMLTFEEKEEYIVIRPLGYLRSEIFAKIATIIRDAGGEYISAGKDSHFRISKEISNQ